VDCCLVGHGFFTGLLVVDVERRHHTVGDDAGPEPPRRAAAVLTGDDERALKEVEA
jgi:hypothetical protein